MSFCSRMQASSPALDSYASSEVTTGGIGIDRPLVIASNMYGRGGSGGRVGSSGGRGYARWSSVGERMPMQAAGPSPSPHRTAPGEVLGATSAPLPPVRQHSSGVAAVGGGSAAGAASGGAAAAGWYAVQDSACGTLTHMVCTGSSDGVAFGCEGNRDAVQC